MTFAAQETSRQQGAPIGLILFTYGPNTGNAFGYTDSETPVTYAGTTYTPVPLDRDSVKSSGTLDKATIEIRVPQDAALTEFFDVWPPSQVVTVQMFQGHVGNTDFKLAWAGRLISKAIQGNEATFTVAPVSTSMKRIGLRRKYGYGCPYVLYGAKQANGSGCGASESAATITVTPAGVAGPIITLATGWNGAIDASKYIGGKASWTTADGRPEFRQIVNDIDATDLLLSGDASSIPAATAIHLALGCSHQQGDCATLHSNIQNFGGEPWIPFLNPVGVVNNFY